MTRGRALLAATTIAAISIIIVNLALAQAGETQSANQTRAGCYRLAKRNIVLINWARSSATISHLVATDPTQSARTRRARSQEVQVDNQAATLLDTQTDQAAWSHATSAIDQHAIRYGLHGHPAFSCQHEFPAPNLIP